MTLPQVIFIKLLQNSPFFTAVCLFFIAKTLVVRSQHETVSTV